MAKPRNLGRNGVVKDPGFAKSRRHGDFKNTFIPGEEMVVRPMSFAEPKDEIEISSTQSLGNGDVHVQRCRASRRRYFVGEYRERRDDLFRAHRIGFALESVSDFLRDRRRAVVWFRLVE